MAGNIKWDDLKDRSVLITGGASGLGEATASKFIQHGAYVTLADLSDDLGYKLVEKLGNHATFVHCDTTDWESANAAFKHAALFAPSKTIDIVILFAGIQGEPGSLVDRALQLPAPDLSSDSIPPKPTHRAIDVNLIGVDNSAHLALHYFRLPSAQPQSFKKSLILVSSIFGYMDVPTGTAYSTSKFGVRGLYRSIRNDGYKVNARINNLAPGFVETPLTKQLHESERGKKLTWTPIDYVVEAAGKCAVDESTDGRTFAIFSSGVEDMQEDIENGWGGMKWKEEIDKAGFFNHSSLAPRKHQT